MKKIILLFLVHIAISNGWAQSNNPLSFSALFNSYEKKYKSLAIFHIENYSTTNNQFFILGKRRKKWEIITWLQKEPFPEPQIKISLCDSCTFNIISGKLDILNNIPNEDALKSVCRYEIDTIINGKKVSEIHDLGGIQDIPLYIIEYKFKKKMRKITYKSPQEALEICPDSEERTMFLKVWKDLTRYFDQDIN